MTAREKKEGKGNPLCTVQHCIFVVFSHAAKSNEKEGLLKTLGKNEGKGERNMAIHKKSISDMQPTLLLQSSAGNRTVVHT